MKLIRLIFFGILFTAHNAFSQEAVLEVNAPKAVGKGEAFKLTYVLKNAEMKSFTPPKINGFNVIGGPSQGSSVSIINGRRSTETSITYMLMAPGEGEFQIGAARAASASKDYTSATLKIKVLNEGKQSNSSNKKALKVDALGRIIVNKKEVYLGQPITGTLKIYYKDQMVNVNEFKDPSFDGFWVEELEPVETLVPVREEYNNQLYNAAKIKKVLLIPQKSGQVKIGGFELDADYKVKAPGVKRRRRSLFEDFFGQDPFNDPFFGGGAYKTIRKSIKSNNVSITVKPFPKPKPSDFDGIVGRFKIFAELDKSEVDQHQAVNLKITIKGTGNFNSVTAPKILFSPDFEVFDPTETAKTKPGNFGINGSKTFEYVIIPRHSGDYEIPESSISYFDLKTKKYKRLKIDGFQLRVKKAEGGQAEIYDKSVLKEEVKGLGSDIRYIHSRADFSKGGYFLIFSTQYFSILGVGFLALIYLMWIENKNKRDKKDPISFKRKKAAHLAQKKLKEAEPHIVGDKNKFYQVLLSCFDSYLMDKFSIDRNQLNKEKIRALLESKAEAEISNKAVKALESWEMKQYAPVTSENPKTDFDLAKNLIIELESTIKKL